MEHNPQVKKHHHHILPTKTALTVFGALLVLTVITVWIAGVDLGALNFPVAMLVATIKASLVALFFMNLKYDNKENSVIFATSFLFLAIFIALTATDLFFRGDVYVKNGQIGFPAPANAKSKFTKPWVSTPELVAHGKVVYMQCAGCHGDAGKGDGAAAASLVPKPRDFTNPEGWKNGRKPSQIFKTLKEGIKGSSMASYAALPADDRWGLVHYVASLGGPVPADTEQDLAAVGIDPNKASAEEAPTAATIPVELAMKRMAEEAAAGKDSHVTSDAKELKDYDARLKGESLSPPGVYSR